MSSKEDEIFTAVENGTYKFALQQCSKLIKKFPNATYYQILNNYILLESGKVDEAIKNCQEIAKKIPNDIKSLTLLNTIFNQVNKTTEALQVYENAAKKYPNFELLTKWFHLGCEESDIRILQKASMALKQFHPTQRLFNLWAAFSYYLVSNSTNSNSIEKTLYPKLGLKIIESLKPFRNEQEVYIMVKLLKLNNKLEDISKVILEFNGEDKLDLELQLILLESFNELNDNENLFKWSDKVLNDYKIDDFNTWKYLIKSNSSKAEEIINSYGDTRNSLLSKIELDLYLKKDLLKSIQNYFLKFGSKICAFYDLKGYLNKIELTNFIQWLKSLELPKIESKSLIWELNVLKFELINDLSIISSPNFISSNISKYNQYKNLLSSKSKTDFFEGDEFILLTVQSLLKQSFDSKTIIKCIVILENLIIKDEHEFHLRLWLIQLYNLINCHSQARHHYESLKIKNIQFDILDQFLLSRFGSIYPNDLTLSKHFDNYEKMELESIYYLKIGFNKAVFNKLNGIIELIQNFKFSILKRHEIIQGLILGRNFNNKDILNSYKKHWKQFKLDTKQNQDIIRDNRDFKIFWNFGINEDFELSNEIFKNIPSKKCDDILSLKEDLINEESSKLLEIDEKDLVEVSNVEKWSIQLLINFKKYLLKEINFEELTKFYKDLIPIIPNDISWEVSHTIITLFDTSKIMQSLITSNLIKNKELKELKELNIELLESLREDLITSTKENVLKQLNSIKNELKQDEDLKLFGIKPDSIVKITEIIEYSNNESFKLMRML